MKASDVPNKSSIHYHPDVGDGEVFVAGPGIAKIYGCGSLTRVFVPSKNKHVPVRRYITSRQRLVTCAKCLEHL